MHTERDRQTDRQTETAREWSLPGSHHANLQTLGIETSTPPKKTWQCACNPLTACRRVSGLWKHFATQPAQGTTNKRHRLCMFTSAAAFVVCLIDRFFCLNGQSAAKLISGRLLVCFRGKPQTVTWNWGEITLIILRFDYILLDWNWSRPCKINNSLNVLESSTFFCAWFFFFKHIQRFGTFSVNFSL